MPRQPTLGRLHGNFFFSRTLIEITIPGFWIKRDQKSVFSLTLCLSHIIIPHDVRCQPTLGQGYFFFFLQSHTHIVLSHAHAFKCESGTLVWLWSGKKAASCETMRSGCIWKLIEPPPQKKCGSGDMWSWEGQGERCTEIARKITLYS